MKALTSTPDSPPAGPVIPEGLATQLGKYGALAAIVVGILLEALGINLSAEAQASLGAAVVLLVTTMLGRYKQAETAIRVHGLTIPRSSDVKYLEPTRTAGTTPYAFYTQAEGDEQTWEQEDHLFDDPDNHAAGNPNEG